MLIQTSMTPLCLLLVSMGRSVTVLQTDTQYRAERGLLDTTQFRIAVQGLSRYKGGLPEDTIFKPSATAGLHSIKGKC